MLVRKTDVSAAGSQGQAVCVRIQTDVQSRNIRFLVVLTALMLFASRSLHAEDNKSKPVVVGYFGQWGLYNDPQYTLKDLVATHQAGLLDQINYAQGFVKGGRCSIADRNADLDHTFSASESVDGKADDPSTPFRGHLHQLAELERSFPHLKALISLEGQASDFAFDAQPDKRVPFVASCVDLFIRGNLAEGVTAPDLFDGIDVDWEYPHGPDADNFVALLAEFRKQMDAVRPGLRLSIAVGPSPRMYAGSDFHAVSAQVDQVGLMTYDMAGPWMQTTGFIKPLFRVTVPEMLGGTAAPSLAPAPTGSQPTASTTPAAKAAVPAGAAAGSSPAPHPPPAGGVAGTVQAFLAAGVPADKLLIGLPFYGYGWTQVPEVADGLYQEGTPVRGDRPYRYIATLTTGSTTYRDPVSQTPWLFDGDAFWTFDDPVSIRAKGEYAVEHQLGGVMIWELAGDTPQGILLNAAHQGLNAGAGANGRAATNERSRSYEPIERPVR